MARRGPGRQIHIVKYGLRPVQFLHGDGRPRRRFSDEFENALRAVNASGTPGRRTRDLREAGGGEAGLAPKIWMARSYC